MTPQLVVVRNPTVRSGTGENFTPGVLYYKGLHFCFTCEDEDRFLENGVTQKVYGRTAIPRGTYKLSVGTHSLNGHPAAEYIEINGIPGYSGVLFHGGNKAEHSLGCILVGKVRTQTGIADCKDTVANLLTIVKALLALGDEVWLEVK